MVPLISSFRLNFFASFKVTSKTLTRSAFGVFTYIDTRIKLSKKVFQIRLLTMILMMRCKRFKYSSLISSVMVAAFSPHILVTIEKSLHVFSESFFISFWPKFFNSFLIKSVFNFLIASAVIPLAGVSAIYLSKKIEHVELV